MKRLRFSHESERNLGQISDWTSENFGRRQENAYKTALLAKCKSLAAGAAPHQSCRDAFAPDLSTDIRFARSGRHFILFFETAQDIIVLAFLHQTTDILGKLAQIAELK